MTFLSVYTTFRSVDNTVKVWDLNSLRCRQTLRGHRDSVNSVQFLSYSNTLCSSSADKTVSLWDARTALCAQTFYGHMHSVNDATFNIRYQKTDCLKILIIIYTAQLFLKYSPLWTAMSGDALVNNHNIQLSS